MNRRSALRSIAVAATAGVLSPFAIASTGHSLACAACTYPLETVASTIPDLGDGLCERCLKAWRYFFIKYLPEVPSPFERDTIIGFVLDEYEDKLNFKDNRTFLFKNRGNQVLFQTYDTASGSPQAMSACYLIYVPPSVSAEDAGKDLCGGPLPSQYQLMEYHYGTRVWPIRFMVGEETTIESVRAKIEDGLREVRSGRPADLFSDHGKRAWEQQQHWKKTRPGTIIKVKA